MAFQQPTFHAPQRTYTALEQPLSDVVSPVEAPLDDSQEWILFSPAPASASYQTPTSASDRTRRTFGHSRNSAFGSLDTAARSYEYDEDSVHTEGAIEDEEDGELDSLDSHLHEFRAEPSVYKEDYDLNQSINPVLPTHDGLGSFRIDQTAMGEGVQEHLYAFEQYNPRRVKRRRESLELGQLELENDRQADLDRTRRIEAWRLEQSRALLEEIQKESRRRKESMNSERRSLINDNDDAEAASMAGDPEGGMKEEHEGFWSRITRRVIQDLMGIDDNTLSILFGESLAVEDELSTTPTTAQSLAQITEMKQDTWEYRLLDRVARELGLLINQLSDHPGAFTTYLQVQSGPLPYAGLPIIPETIHAEKTSRSGSFLTDDIPQFQPTLTTQTPAMDIPTPTSSRTIDIDATLRPNAPIHDGGMDLTKEQWEKQLDIKMVFRYLRSRFTSRSASPEPTFHTSASSPNLQSDQARAARVRQHHPLVSRSRPERKTFKVSIPGGGSVSHSGSAVLHSPKLLNRRSSSSCASGLKGKRGGSGGSSRHYWDLGGSLGSGSLVASGGGLGAWGDC